MPMNLKVWFGDPEYALHARFPGMGGALAVHNLRHNQTLLLLGAPSPLYEGPVTQKRRCASS
jgi:hypothetical protein